MINVAIVGYGNLGRGVERALSQNPDFSLSAVFTRRNPSEIKPLDKNVKVDSLDNVLKYKGKLDLLFLCGGSATDLPELAPELLRNFNCIDSFDTHAKIPAYLSRLDAVGRASGTLGLVSVGWDPGLFSVARVLFSSVLPEGATNTFWGRGVSQGHSDAIRRINGVKYAVQYTIPKQDGVAKARNGGSPSVKEKHLRQCFVVADVSEQARIKNEIINMPDYFAGYDVEVNFISEAEFKRAHTGMPHGGLVLRSGKSGGGFGNTLELDIKLDSNPEFTGSVLAAYARALYKMKQEGRTGALTVFDVPPAYLMVDRDKAIKELL